MQFSNLELAKPKISSAFKTLVEEIKKNNREFADAPHSKAFTRLTMAILGDMLSQSAILESWYYANTVTLTYFTDAEHCVYHLESSISSNDIIIQMSYDEAQDVLEKVYYGFKSLNEFSAFSDSHGKDKYTFLMNV